VFGIHWADLAVLVVLGLVLFGPDRLPKVAGDAARVLRQLRQMAQSATDELKAELGPEMADLDLTTLNPRRFVQKHLFEDPEPVRRAPAATTVGGPALGVDELPPYDQDAT
jgi:sec-independent protein translocase protein TatB